MLLLQQTSLAQTSITGNIVDAKTKKPIAHVEVFISGTTTGCITDKLGNFKINAPFFPCVLVVDHVSYDSFIKPLKTAEKLEIELNPSVFSINEVSVSGKNKRKKNMRFFYSRFIPEDRSEIRILNDSLLVFQRDKMEFKASSNKALILVNSVLGYRIKVVLEEFKVIALDSPKGKQIPLNSMNGGEVLQLTGFYFYESLEDQFPDKKIYFEKNRRKSYYGSYRHFLKSIYDNNPEQEGFEVKAVSDEVVEERELVATFSEIPLKQNLNNAKVFMINADKVKVFYYYDDKGFPVSREEIEDRFYVNRRESYLYPSKEPFLIRENGTSPTLTFVIDGLMVTKSFANSLPEDYLPSRNKLVQ